MKIKSTFILPMLAASIVMLAGCSSVNFYEEENGSSINKGFLYYPSKPYVLIEDGEKTTSTKIITLPDLERPHRVKYTGGFGSAEMGFDVENGMIKSFNSKTDSKTPETITSLTGIATAKAAILTAKAAMAEATKELQPSSGAKELLGSGMIKYDVGSIVKTLDIVSKKVVPVLSQSPTESIYDREIKILKDQLVELGKISSIIYPILNQDKLIDTLESFRKKSEDINNELKGVSTSLKVYGENPKIYPNDFKYALDANNRLAKAVKILSAFSARKSSIAGLYEIEFLNGILKLRKVSFE